MKNTSISLVVLLLAFVSVTSCRQKTIRTIDKAKSERYYLAPDTSKGSLNIEIDVEIPVCLDSKTVLGAVRNEIVLNLFGAEYLQYHNDSLVTQFVADIKKEYKLTNEPILIEMDSNTPYSFNNEHLLDGFSLLSDEKIFSYGINRYVFMGGAHGLNTVNYFNFNLNTGKKILEDDIFLKGTSTKLAEIIRKRIVEQSNEYEGVETMKSLDKSDYWVDAIKPNSNFYFTSEGINYVFNPYEIGPYYLGITEVRIPYKRIQNLLKPNSLISYLSKKVQVK